MLHRKIEPDELYLASRDELDEQYGLNSEASNEELLRLSQEVKKEQYQIDLLQAAFDPSRMTDERLEAYKHEAENGSEFATHVIQVIASRKLLGKEVHKLGCAAWITEDDFYCNCGLRPHKWKD